MKNAPSTQHDSVTEADQHGEFTVADIIKYLRRLARFHEDDQTGNVELSRALRQLSGALRTYDNRKLSELSLALRVANSPGEATRTSPAGAVEKLPKNVESIGHQELEIFLANERHTKKQLVEVGFRRFGISRSQLDRLPKSEAKDSVRAALEHEKSLEAISSAARGMNLAPGTRRHFASRASTTRK